MTGIDILEPKNETQTSFEYLKNKTEQFFFSYSDVFDSDFKQILIILCLKKKKILITSYFQEKF